MHGAGALVRRDRSLEVSETFQALAEKVVRLRGFRMQPNRFADFLQTRLEALLVVVDSSKRVAIASLPRLNLD